LSPLAPENKIEGMASCMSPELRLVRDLESTLQTWYSQLYEMMHQFEKSSRLIL
jgi:hypothetical protein